MDEETRRELDQIKWDFANHKHLGVLGDAIKLNHTSSINMLIDGGGSVLTTGIKGDITVPFDCTLVSVSALADQTGSIVVDVWKDTLDNFPPTDADSITGTPITIDNAISAEDTDVSGWVTDFLIGDILRFNVDSCTTITRVSIELRVARG